MRIPNDLRQLASEAFTTDQPWAEFIGEHRDAIRRAEPYNASRFHRLAELVRSVVVSGSTSGLFAVGDDDAACEWFGDDSAQQTTLFNMADQYR